MNVVIHALTKELHVDSLATAVRTVKILALWIRTLCLDTVVELLKCFPCLENIYIKVIILHQDSNYSFDLLCSQISSDLFYHCCIFFLATYGFAKAKQFVAA